MRIRAIFVCIAINFPMVSAMAQNTGTHIGPSPAQMAHGTLSPVDRGRITMQNYAKCTGESARRSVESYLATFPGSKLAIKKVRSITEIDCFSSGEMRFQEGLYRGSAYEYLYRTDYSRSKTPDFSSLASVDFSVGASAVPKPDEDVHIGLRKFADCVVRENTEVAHALVFSYLVSEEEKRIFRSLRPAFNSCMSKTVDMTIKFSMSVLRGLIAEVLYRNAKSMPVSVTSLEDKR